MKECENRIKLVGF